MWSQGIQNKIRNIDVLINYPAQNKLPVIRYGCNNVPLFSVAKVNKNLCHFNFSPFFTVTFVIPQAMLKKFLMCIKLFPEVFVYMELSTK